MSPAAAVCRRRCCMKVRELNLLSGPHGRDLVIAVTQFSEHLCRVLTQLGRWPAERGLPRAVTNRMLENSDTAGAGMIELEDRRNVLDGSIVERLIQGVDRRAPDAVRPQDVEPFCGRPLAEVWVESRTNLVALAECDRGVLVGLQRSWAAEYIRDRLDRRHGDRQVAIGRRIK